MNFRTICYAILSLSVFIASGCKREYIEIMAVTGATPTALKEEVPTNVSLKFDGMVKRNYVFSGNALRAMASMRIRVKEITPDGKFMGTYAYTGIPLNNLLEGIAPCPPHKKETSIADRFTSSMKEKIPLLKKEEEYPFHPVDILVTLESRNGKRISFSYGELVFCEDRNPALLAFHRKEVRSGKHPEKYTKNIYKGNIKGLRLVVPVDSDTSRYLDDVVKISYSTLSAPDRLLPRVKSFKEVKKKKCTSESVICIDGARSFTLDRSNFSVKKYGRWIRFGHGHGFAGISAVEGISFADLLRKNFKNTGLKDFFLVTGCDGYRILVSGYEVFDKKDPDDFLLVTKIDGGLPPGNIMISAVRDFYIDRDAWGVTNIVRLTVSDKPEDVSSK